MAKKRKKIKPNTVDSIVAELTAAVRKGLGKKRATQKAKDFWLAGTVQSVTTQLKSGDTWDADKKNALPTARKMGRVAAVLADGGLVLLWAAQAAHRAIKDDPRCPGVGGGGYCDF